uniref:Uncharacterized protein n=1 Tax=uncultured marine virus TaxID=186617 RepID=A0A0F7L540_9VIRU|nr:hypothetical protein [uncultured marine virus]
MRLCNVRVMAPLRGDYIPYLRVFGSRHFLCFLGKCRRISLAFGEVRRSPALLPVAPDWCRRTGRIAMVRVRVGPGGVYVDHQRR